MGGGRRGARESPMSAHPSGSLRLTLDSAPMTHTAFPAPVRTRSRRHEGPCPWEGWAPHTVAPWPPAAHKARGPGATEGTQLGASTGPQGSLRSLRLRLSLSQALRCLLGPHESGGGSVRAHGLGESPKIVTSRGFPCPSSTSAARAAAPSPSMLRMSAAVDRRLLARAVTCWRRSPRHTHPKASNRRDTM
jgi:hypothetical protein